MSSPISRLADEYDVVVIGSGYGGGIAASRLARAGRRVCLLERGRERWPGDFPDTALDALHELQVRTADADHGSPTGLYVLHAGDDINVFSGCGLGGTSLINANVAIEADPRVFEQSAWPSEIRTDAKRIEQARVRAWDMLRPAKLPEPKDPKVATLELAAQRAGRGDHFRLTDITVAFQDGPNAAGVEQRECTRCGDCCSGCNVGAKTTTMLTYVADAFAHQASIFTEVSVHHLSRPREDGPWLVHVEYLGVGRERFHGPLATIRAGIVVVAAGVLGSTGILKRSECDGGVRFSKRLGTRFSGNGDVLAFAYDTERPVRGVGWGHRTHVGDPDRHVGPCITGVVDERDPNEPLTKGHIVEEGSIPGALEAGMPTTLAAAALFDSKRDGRHEHFWRHTLDMLESFTPGGSTGALAKTLTYLVMGHDDSGGEVVLENDRVRVQWEGVADQPTFRETDHLLANLSRRLGGWYVRDPLWSEKLTGFMRRAQKVPILRRILWHPKVRALRQIKPLKRRHRKDHFSVITVHPLGGCPMGTSGADGVVDHAARVFSGSSGNDVHEGLYVMDGSIVPTSLGCNPLLTISTLSERACALMCKAHDWPFEKRPEAANAIDLPEPAVGVEFTEQMAGEIRVGPDQSDLSMLVTVEIEDIEALVADPSRPSGIAGTVAAACLSTGPLTVVGGELRLFVRASRASEIEHMEYRLPLVSDDGDWFLLDGAKTIGARSILHGWHETTTLAVTVSKGRDGSGGLVGSGTVRIATGDFVHQLRTVRGTGGSSDTERRKAVEHYLALFGGDLFEHYLGVVAPDELFDRDRPPRPRRRLHAPAPEYHDLDTADGLTLRLTRYHGGRKGPVLLAHGMGVSSEIFSTDLIDTNLVEYLTAHHYDVWALDLRVSTALPSSAWQSTADSVAEFDHPAAVAAVLEATGAKSLQAVVHCYGSNTFVMSMLKGWTPSASVRSMVCSEVATHLDVATEAKLKAGLHTPGLLEKLGVETITAYVDSGANWRGRVFDDALHLQHVPRSEHCHSAVCHRVTFLFSMLYRHANLTQRMHDNLHELFGVVNLLGMEQLATMVRHGHVVEADGSDTYLSETNIRRLALPILLISGGDNRCYLPSSTEKTRELLAEVNDPQLYERTVIPGYGHLDCIFGAAAVDDVFPGILAHLEAHEHDAR